MKTFIIGSVLLSFTVLQFAAAKEWTVKKDGGGDYETIQAAINASSEGDVIVVHPGIYTSTENEVIDFLGKGITVKSFKSIEESSDPTYINGQLMRRGVYFGNSETSLSILEGFTITECVAPSNGDAPAYGGGILCEHSSSPKIIDCIITNNTAPAYETNYGWFAGHGGGVALLSQSNPTIEGCHITNNNAIPVENESESMGGGIFCDQECTLTITGSSITNNTSSSGAGIYCLGNAKHPSESIIENCTISMNNAIEIETQGGGGIMCYSYAIDRISNCTISENVAWTGGGIRTTKKGAEPIIEYCVFSNNTATHPSWNGGGLCSDGWSVFAAEPKISNTLFCGNFEVHIYGRWKDEGDNEFNDTCCQSDIDGNGHVDVDDILIIVSEWGFHVADADINSDGFVDTDDLLQLIADWGPCP